MTFLKTIILGIILGMLVSPSQSTAFLSSSSMQTTPGLVSPRLAVDSGGAIYLVWKEMRNSQSGRIFFNRSTDAGKSWPQEARWLDREQADGARSSSPRLDNDGKGHVYAVWWTKHRDGKKDVLLRTSRDFGASFGPTVKLNKDYGAFPPEVSTDGQGHIYVVWADERTEAESDSQREKSSGHRIYFNRSDDHGGTWLPEDIKLSGDAAGSGRMMQAWPQIRSDDRGHVYAMWFDTRDGGGGATSGPRTISAGHGGRSSG